MQKKLREEMMMVLLKHSERLAVKYVGPYMPTNSEVQTPQWTYPKALILQPLLYMHSTSWQKNPKLQDQKTKPPYTRRKLSKIKI